MPYRVVIIESERGWGSKIDDIIYFKTDVEAREFQKKYNSHNKPGPAPDWYMRAEDPVFIAELPVGKSFYSLPSPKHANDN